MAQDNLIGKTVNGYEIVGVVGRGGMATVYRAQQISMNRTVALKVLPRQYVDDDTYIARFKREVEIVSRLEHRSIVPVYDYGEIDRQPYIVMRYMPAGSVDSLLLDGAVKMERIIEIVTQVAPALDYAHAKNVLHRDLKPSNILLDDGGGAYITDFGIARILGEATGNTITTQGVVGTPAYMSPEQAQGRPLDGRSDVYSLGVMLFEMATGRRPFESDTPYGLAVMQVTTPPPAPRSINPALPPRVEQVIFRAMDKSADTRYQTSVALAEALDQAWNSPEEAEDTQKRHAFTPPPANNGPAYSPAPAQPSYTPPYAPSGPVSAGQSAWIPPVDTPRPSRKKRRRANPWMSLFIGVSIGCALLTALVAGTAYYLGANFEALFDAPPATLPPDDQPDVTPGGINIIGTRQSTPEEPSDATEDEPDVRVLPSNTPPPPTDTPTQAAPTDTPGPTGTPTVAPIGVRPEGGARIEPTGEVVYFTEQDGNYDLFRLDVGSGRVRRLTYGARADQVPAVSPDGQTVAFLGVQEAVWDVHLYDLATTGVERLTQAPMDIRAPAWSPDGEWLAFAGDPRADGNYDLFRMRADGTDLELLLSNGQRNTSPSWYGDRIAFATGDRFDARTWEIALLDIPTGDVTVLTDNDVKDWNPRWGPGGGVLLYHTDGAGGSAIAVLDMQGTAGSVTVYDGPGYEWGAAYSPGGDFITFASDETGRDQLYLYDGAEAVALTENGGFPAAWVPS